MTETHRFIHSIQPNLLRAASVLVATLVHISAFLLLYPKAGPELSLIAVLPITVIAWHYKRRAGLLAGLLAIVLNAMLFGALGISLTEAVSHLSSPGSVILIIFGGIVGRSSELLEQVHENSRALEHEIAERKVAEQALYKAKEEAERANRAKSEFVSMVSHELRSPITAIRLGEELLSAKVPGELNDNQRALLQTIGGNADRMMELVSDLTDVSRLESGSFLIRRAPTSLREVMDEACTSLLEQIKANEQELTVQMPSALPMVWCDRDRLLQVLTNLLSNASKYTPAGGKITINARRLPAENGYRPPAREICVTVRDSGIGISPVEQGSIFEKFFRGESAQATAPRGTGLGLAISKQLVEMQGGRIWFESTLNQGSQFHFTLPVAN